MKKIAKSINLTKSFVVRCLLNENNWKPGDALSFTYQNYELTLKRENNIYAPYIFAVNGKGHFPTHDTQIGRRYQSMERAFLHILNHFNENVNIRDKYITLDQWFDK